MLDFSLSNSLSHCSRAHSANWADGADPTCHRYLTRKQAGFSCGGLPVPHAYYTTVPRGSRQAGVSMPTKVSSAPSLWFIYSSRKALVELTAWSKSSHLTGEAGWIPSYCREFFSLTFHYRCVQTHQWIEHKSEVHEPSTASAIINTSPVISIDLTQIDSITEESTSQHRIAQLSKL